MSMRIEFKNQNVFVAGGTSGINLGIAMSFARAGARVCVMSRSQDKVDAAVARLQEAGSKATGFAADVRDFDAVHAAFSATHDEYGAIDVLISGAAGNFPAFVTDLSPNGFKSVVDIDLIGSFHVLKAAFDFLSKPGASIINISAPQAKNAMQAQIHVCAAKAGVDMLTRVLAMEWGQYGIRVNSIIPGPIEGTEGMRRLAPSTGALDKIAASVPLGRLGTVEDVGRAALIIASPLAAYITGAVIPVDGGWSLGGDQVAMAALTRYLQENPSLR